MIARRSQFLNQNKSTMKVVGYCIIKKDAKSGMSPLEMSEFINGRPIRVYEFSKVDGSVLVINNEATGLVTFDKEDIQSSFRCEMLGNVCVSPDLNLIERSLYAAKVLNRKGGYNDLLMNMVIASCLHYGCLLYTSPSPRDATLSRMPSSA